MSARSGRPWRRIREEVFATYGTVCWLCNYDGADTVDHIIPTAQGGSDDLDNLRPAHGRGRPDLGCVGNYGRGARMWMTQGPPQLAGRCPHRRDCSHPCTTSGVWPDGTRRGCQPDGSWRGDDRDW